MSAISTNLIIITVGTFLSAIFQVGKKYIVTTFQLSQNKPKELAGTFVTGALYFAYNVFQISLGAPLHLIQQTISTTSSIELVVLMRCSLVFAGITMLFGPFLVLPPIKPIVLKKETFFKKMVKGAQKKETRYTTFAIFCVISLLQAFVVFSLWQLLYVEFKQELRLVLGVTVGYALVCLFYLVIMYSVMMKKDVVIKGINLLEQIRRNCVIRRRNKPPIHLLDNKHYVKIYLVLFVLAWIAAVALTVVVFVGDLNSPIWSTFGGLAQGIVIGFFVVQLLSVIVYTIFILNVAFNPVQVTDVVLADGTVVSTTKIRFVTVARSLDRVILLERDNRGDPDTVAIRDSMRRIVQLPDTMAAPWIKGVHQLTSDMDGVNGRVHQSNDEACMYLVCVGCDYSTVLADYFLTELRDTESLREAIDGVTDIATYKPNTWLNAAPLIRPAVDLLVERFQDDEQQEALMEAADKASEQETGEMVQITAVKQEIGLTCDVNKAKMSLWASEWSAPNAQHAAAIDNQRKNKYREVKEREWREKRAKREERRQKILEEKRKKQEERKRREEEERLRREEKVEKLRREEEEKKRREEEKAIAHAMEEMRRQAELAAAAGPPIPPPPPPPYISHPYPAPPEEEYPIEPIPTALEPWIEEVPTGVEPFIQPFYGGMPDEVGILEPGAPVPTAIEEPTAFPADAHIGAIDDLGRISGPIVPTSLPVAYAPGPIEPPLPPTGPPPPPTGPPAPPVVPSAPSAFPPPPLAGAGAGPPPIRPTAVRRPMAMKRGPPPKPSEPSAPPPVRATAARGRGPPRAARAPQLMDQIKAGKPLKIVEEEEPPLPPMPEPSIEGLLMEKLAMRKEAMAEDKEEEAAEDMEEWGDEDEEEGLDIDMFEEPEVGGEAIELGEMELSLAGIAGVPGPEDYDQLAISAAPIEPFLDEKMADVEEERAKDDIAVEIPPDVPKVLEAEEAMPIEVEPMPIEPIAPLRRRISAKQAVAQMPDRKMKVAREERKPMPPVSKKKEKKKAKKEVAPPIPVITPKPPIEERRVSRSRRKMLEPESESSEDEDEDLEIEEEKVKPRKREVDRLIVPVKEKRKRLDRRRRSWREPRPLAPDHMTADRLPVHLLQESSATSEALSKHQSDILLRKPALVESLSLSLGVVECMQAAVSLVDGWTPCWTAPSLICPDNAAVSLDGAKAKADGDALVVVGTMSNRSRKRAPLWISTAGYNGVTGAHVSVTLDRLDPLPTNAIDDTNGMRLLSIGLACPTDRAPHPSDVHMVGSGKHEIALTSVGPAVMGSGGGVTWMQGDVIDVIVHGGMIRFAINGVPVSAGNKLVVESAAPFVAPTVCLTGVETRVELTTAVHAIELANTRIKSDATSHWPGGAIPTTRTLPYTRGAPSWAGWNYGDMHSSLLTSLQPDIGSSGIDSISDALNNTRSALVTLLESLEPFSRVLLHNGAGATSLSVADQLTVCDMLGLGLQRLHWIAMSYVVAHDTSEHDSWLLGPLETALAGRAWCAMKDKDPKLVLKSAPYYYALLRRLLVASVIFCRCHAEWMLAPTAVDAAKLPCWDAALKLLDMLQDESYDEGSSDDSESESMDESINEDNITSVIGMMRGFMTSVKLGLSGKGSDAVKAWREAQTDLLEETTDDWESDDWEESDDWDESD